MITEDGFEVDELALYFGSPYPINAYITVTLPTIGELVEYGERQYFSLINTLCAISSDMKSSLWDSGLDWTTVQDFDLFIMMTRNLPVEKTKIILGDVDLSQLRPFENKNTGGAVLYNPDTGAILDELAYKKMFSYLCKAHNITKKVEKAANSYTKKILIDEDRQKIERAKNEPYKSFLKPLISSVKCRMGYSLNYIKQMGLMELFDDLNRLQIIVNTDALLGGMYSGFVDTSKIPQSKFDWTREIVPAKQSGMTL